MTTADIISHQRKNINLKEPCIFLLVTKQSEGYQEENRFKCELQGVDTAIIGPKIVDIDGAINKWLEPAGLMSGKTTLFSPDLYIIGNTLKLLDSVFAKNKLMLGTVEHNEKLVAVEGEKTVLVVRVQASNKVTSSSEAHLRDSVFGNGKDYVNLSSQYSDCSANKLNFIKRVTALVFLQTF